MAKPNSFILGAHRYQVVAPAVAAETSNGGVVMVYQRGLLPTDTSQTQVAQVLKQRAIRELGEVAR